MSFVDKRARVLWRISIATCGGDLPLRLEAEPHWTRRDVLDSLQEEGRLLHGTSFLACGETLAAAGIQNEDLLTLVRQPPPLLLLTNRGDGSAQILCPADGSIMQTLVGHTWFIMHASWSSDLGMIVTASEDHSAKVWNVESGKCLHTLEHSRYVCFATFDGKSQRIVTASQDETVKLWSVESGTCIRTLHMSTEINCAAFSPDGQFLVVSGYAWNGGIWNTLSGEFLHVLRHSDDILCVAWSFDGSLVASSSEDGIAKLWRLEQSAESCRCLQTFVHSDFPNRKARGVHKVVFSPDSLLLVTASYDHTARIWTTSDTSRCVHVLRHRKGLLTAEFLQDGRMVATASYDRTAKFWSVVSGECLRTCNISENGAPTVNRIAFTQDASVISTLNIHGKAQIFRVSMGGNYSCSFDMTDIGRLAFAPS